MKLLTAIPRWLIALVVSLLPILATYLLVRFHLGVHFFNFTPFYWNDQTWYWHQTLSFSRVGFASGYYVVNEATAPLTFFKFSSAGPLFPVVYGIIGHFVGWSWFTGIAFNIVLLVGATLAFIYLANLNKTQIILTGLTLLFIGPVLMFLPTNSLEPFHQAAALILAALFYRLWTRTMSRRLWWIGLVFFILISLLRFSWVILLPVYFLLRYDQLTVRRMLISFVASGLLAVVIYVLVSMMTSPGHNAIVARVGGIQDNVIAAMNNLVKNARNNLAQSFQGVGGFEDAFADRIQVLQIAFIIASSLVMTIQTFKLRSHFAPKLLEMPFHIYNLVVIVVLSMFLYIPAGFYRIFGIHLLLSILLLITFRRFILVSIVIVLGAITLGSITHSYDVFTVGNLTQNVPALEAAREQWSALMPYQQGADAWCNTILMPVSMLDGRILKVPPGIGVTFYIGGYSPPTAQKPVRSHYLLLNADAFQYLNNGNLHVQLLADTPDGTLYVNQDAPCTPHPTK